MSDSVTGTPDSINAIISTCPKEAGNPETPFYHRARLRRAASAPSFRYATVYALRSVRFAPLHYGAAAPGWRPVSAKGQRVK